MIWNGVESNYFKLFPNLLHTIQYTQARFICRPSCTTAPDKCVISSKIFRSLNCNRCDARIMLQGLTRDKQIRTNSQVFRYLIVSVFDTMISQVRSLEAELISAMFSHTYTAVIMADKLNLLYRLCDILVLAHYSTVRQTHFTRTKRVY